MAFFTPPNLHIRSQPVFKTPMSFSPRLQGEKAKPSPSRFELWKEELGIEDETERISSNSDDEPEVDQNTNKIANCTLVEYQALQRELEERNVQRDDLLYSIKMLNDKNKAYSVRLDKEESRKKQQLAILKKTHDTALQGKDSLIAQLEALVDEQDSKLNDENPTAPDGYESIKKMTKHIKALQDENVAHVNKIATFEVEISRLKEQLEEDETRHKETLQKLEKEQNNLEEQLVQLRSIQSSGSTDSEKQACQLEIENCNLKRELQDMKEQFVAAQTGSAGQTGAGDGTHTQKLKEDNDELKQRISALEEELRSKTEEVDDSERDLRDQVTSLTRQCQNSDRQVRELSAQIAALHARSPDVVTKVQRVEIESVESQSALKDASAQNAQLQLQLQLLQEEHREATASLQDGAAREKAQLQGQVAQYNSKVEAYEAEVAELKQLLEEELAAAQERQDEAVATARRDADASSAQLHKHLRHMQSQHSMLRKALADLKQDYKSVKRAADNMPATIKSEVERTTKQICKALSELNAYNSELVKKYRKEMMLRKKYHNELVELKAMANWT